MLMLIVKLRQGFGGHGYFLHIYIAQQEERFTFEW